MGTPDDDWLVPPRYWRWLFSRRTAVAVLWLVCLAVAGQRMHRARENFATPDDPALARPSGNGGHAEIDFGGQWLMGRMVYLGYADRLYDRNIQWQVVRAGYPVSAEPQLVRDHAFPTHLRPLDEMQLVSDPRHDADKIMGWVMGADAVGWQTAGPAAVLPVGSDHPLAAAAYLAAARDAVTPELVAEVNLKRVGGPLYPPVHGFFYLPVGAFADPADGYLAFQLFLLGLTFAGGYCLSAVSRGRVWWPAATLVLLLYPGYRGGIDLGQNPLVTLTVLAGGWALVVRGRDGWGGAVWGLLAFKPLWAVAFLLVPLLMGRWRMAAAMAAVGAGLVAATLPFTGLQTWRDWLAVGAAADLTYRVNENWITLSRDLHGLFRRMLLDFTIYPEAKRLESAWAEVADLLGWLVWGTVFGVTAVVYWVRAYPGPGLGTRVWRWAAAPDRPPPTGLAAGFLLLGAWLCCYRFMYYDVLLSLLAFAALFADPGRLLRSAVLVVRAVPARPPTLLAPMPMPDPTAGRTAAAAYVNSFPLTLLGLLLLGENVLMTYGSEFTVRAEVSAQVAGGLRTAGFPKLTAVVGYYTPWETVLLLALWAWAGLRLAVSSDDGR